ncbi:uncharacterized protein HGUI_02327 [Hanseniaspora guilliermondii]|uniref:Zn(2)-C6 fungal-type domain-containing protein n=1 Tax=Hanseniaspora guilliermondii TaxID=56406 RepID=A0A1L0CZ25_9ASCO|nr:uncharacterized protein HGUI_02327 [Hanseniaspora guilliermondii]
MTKKEKTNNSKKNHDVSSSSLNHIKNKDEIPMVVRCCEMCRQKKRKCSKTIPCTACVKFHHNCVYRPKEEKTPLTRARMTALENGIGKISKILKSAVKDKAVLETLLSKSQLKLEDLNSFEHLVDFPGHENLYVDMKTIKADDGNEKSLDLENVSHEVIPSTVNSLSPSSNNNTTNKSVAQNGNTSIVLSNSDRSEELKLLKQIKTKVKKIKRNGIKGQEKVQFVDTTPTNTPNDELNGFNWVEMQDHDLKYKNDGMAALSVNPNNKGYFGQGSTANMLRTTLLVTNGIESDGNSEQGLELLKVSRDLADELRSYEVRESLINAYFEHYHSSYPFLDKDWFLKKFKNSKDQASGPQPTVKELSSKDEVDPDLLKQAIENDDFLILLNTVCALGCWCLQGQVLAMTNMDMFYYKEAKALITSALFERGSIPLVTAFTLLSNFVQKRDKPNTGWNYLGIASRMAMGLGLYKELNLNTKDTSEELRKQKILNLEIRRRLWWGLYMFDVGTAITFGRPVNFPSSANFDIKLPSNMDEKGNVFHTKPTVYSGLIEQTKFTKISLEIHSKLLSNQPPSSKECLKLNENIEAFMKQLPEWFSKSNDIALPSIEPLMTPDPTSTSLKVIPHWFHLTRYRLILRTLNLQILMLQNFVWQDIMGRNEMRYTNYVRTHPSIKRCINICFESCSESINLVREYVDSVIEDKKYDSREKKLVTSNNNVTSPATIMNAIKEINNGNSITPSSVNKSESNLGVNYGGMKSPSIRKSLESGMNGHFLGSLSGSDYSNTNGSNSPEILNKPHVSMLASWYATYFLFQATVIPMICLIYNDENCNLHQWNSWKEQVCTAQYCFKILSGTNKTAAHFLKIIEDMCGNILKQESAAPFSPSTSNMNLVNMKNKTKGQSSGSSPFAIGSVYNNNNIFDSQGKIRAENSDFAIGTPFEKDMKMNLSNSLMSNNAQGNTTGYLFGNGSPIGISGYNLTGPFISKRQTSDIRATNSPKPMSPSVMMGNDIPAYNGSSIEMNMKQGNKSIPLNPFNIEEENSEEHEDDNLFGFGRGMGLEALATNGSNANLDSLLNIFGEAGIGIDTNKNTTEDGLDIPDLINSQFPKKD